MTTRAGFNWLELGKGLITIIGLVGGGAGVYSVQSTSQGTADVSTISTRLELHSATDSINRLNTLKAIERIETSVSTILEEQRKQSDAFLVLVTKLQR